MMQEYLVFEYKNKKPRRVSLIESDGSRSCIVYSHPTRGFALNLFAMNRKKNKQQVMNLQVTNDLTVAVIPDTDHEFTMPTKEVAKGYGTSDYSLRMAKKRHQLELIEGKHFISNVTLCHGASPGASKATMWTKRGIVRLGFFIRSQRAKMFRDWAEDLVINHVNQKTPNTAATYIQQAIAVCGSNRKLASRIGVAPGSLSTLQTRPHMFNSAFIARVIQACSKIIEQNGAIDTSSLEMLMQVEDKDIRLGLYNKMKKGGLL